MVNFPLWIHFIYKIWKRWQSLLKNKIVIILLKCLIIFPFQHYCKVTQFPKSQPKLYPSNALEVISGKTSYNVVLFLFCLEVSHEFKRLKGQTNMQVHQKGVPLKWKTTSPQILCIFLVLYIYIFLYLVAWTDSCVHQKLLNSYNLCLGSTGTVCYLVN